MTTITNVLEAREYSLIGILDDEQDAIEQVANEYEGSVYICDAITETADGFTPIYNHDVWENVSDIQDYIEEAIAQGLAPTDHSNVDLIGIFRAGYYEYYTQAINNNIDEIVYNYTVNRIHSELQGFDASKVDADAVETALDDALAEVDHNDMYNHLEEIATEIADDIMNGNYDK